MDRRYWDAIESSKDGRTYHYAEFSASTRVQDILFRAQANQAELGYWRDVATDLAALVDKLELRLKHSLLNEREIDRIWYPNCGEEIRL